MSSCYFCGRIAAIKAGKDSHFVAELDESYVVLSDEQFYRGYCILLLKDHEEHVHRLDAARNARLSAEVAAVGTAIEKICGAPRLNYACLGNEVPHIHWHVIPRYADDPEKSKPTWLRPVEQRRKVLPAAELAELRSKVAAAIPGKR